MVLSYKEAVEMFGNEYALSKAVLSERIFKIESGLYSTNEFESELAVILKKYPKGVLTGESAFYYHGLSDVIPDQYFLATPSKAAMIKDDRVFQVFVNERVFSLGISTEIIEGTEIKIYDKERMLIELLRNKNSMPYDYYKEILLVYRSIVNDLDVRRIQEYTEVFPKSNMIRTALDKEVF